MIFGVFGVITMLLACCFRKSVSLAVAIIKVSAKFIMESKSILLVPLVMFVLCLGYFCFWVAAAAYLYSCGTVS